MTTLEQMLIRHEGLKLKPYRCSKGKLTIGVGHNLDDNGITQEIAMVILRHDISTATADLLRAYPWAKNLSASRRDALINMVFNMGLPRFSTFKKMLAALKAGDYVRAHDEMLDSKWAAQVGDRALELAMIIKKGDQ